MTLETVENMIWVLVAWNVVLTVIAVVGLVRWRRALDRLSGRLVSMSDELHTLTEYLQRVNGRVSGEDVA